MVCPAVRTVVHICPVCLFTTGWECCSQRPGIVFPMLGTRIPNRLGTQSAQGGLWDQQGRVSIAQEAEIVAECIIIDLAPVAFHEGTHQ